MPKVAIDTDTELYYESHGSGPPLFLVTGLGGMCAFWHAQVPALSAHYRVILHDHRGTGQSTHSQISYSVDQMAGDALSLMDALDLESAHFVGHSTGGAMGQTIAATHPERLRSLVLSATWPRADEYFRRCFDSQKSILRGLGVEAFARAYGLFLYPEWWISADPEAFERYVQATVQNFSSAEIFESRIDAIVAFDRSADLSAISVPTLVVAARDDRVTPRYFSETLADLIPTACLALLETGGHFCPQTVADEYNRVLRDFLGRNAG